VIRLVSAVAGPKAELFKEFDDPEKLVERLFGEKLITEADARSLLRTTRLGNTFVVTTGAMPRARLLHCC
jgi:hypothetical protein